ncbi:hypothetical protein KC19_VG025100 [Ceratodon purpureus]|uniref:Uncharacterized protein n=1 Tax=Ceratodon purpureus TaxID=3225 RepID=A0A8T0HLC6_CERPU|nr:hypothetical protein KC19_VG025100 [Ceratodon purpureus]
MVYRFLMHILVNFCVMFNAAFEEGYQCLTFVKLCGCFRVCSLELTCHYCWNFNISLPLL